MIFGRLAITQADGQKTVAMLNKSTVRIGRSPDNDVVLDDEQVAPYHAQVLCDARGCQILDLGSAGGTSVDGAKLTRQQPQQLPDNAVIQIGRARMTFSVDGSGRDSTTAKLVSSRANEDLLTSLLGADGPRPTPALGSPRAPAEAPTEAMPTPPSGPQVRLSINPTDLRVDAGGIITLTATIVNTSRIVDRIDLSVDGIEAAWVKIVPPNHRLRPGEKAESQIVIAPPRAPTSTAGIYRFSVVARAAQRPGDAVAAEAELTVLPFTEFRFEMVPPKEQTGWWQANYTMRLVNRGNSSQPFEIQGANDENVFTFQTTPPAPVVAAGKEAKLRLATRLRLARWFGRPKTYQFTVSATPVDATAPTQQVDGRFIQEPPLKWWLLLLMAALVTLSLLACLLSLLLPFILSWLNRPSTTPSTTTPVGIIQPLPSALAPDAAGTAQALGAAQQATQVAQTTAFAQTSQAVAGANSETQTAVAAGVAGTQTAVALAFAQTSTASGLVSAQTQAALVAAGGAASTAQANLNATATAAKAAADATLTALPGANAATLTAVAEAFNVTRTAESLALTQTALARPTDTPTPSPTPIPRFDQIVSFDKLNGTPVTKRTPIEGIEYAGQDLAICFYQIAQPTETPTDTPTDTPTVSPTLGTSVGVAFKTIAAPAAIQASTRCVAPDINEGLELRQPVLYPAPVPGINGLAPVVTTDESEGVFRDEVIGVGIFQRNVTEVSAQIWNPNSIPTLYLMYGFDEQGKVVALSPRERVSVPGPYQLIVSSDRPMRMVAILGLTDAGEINASSAMQEIKQPQTPIFISSISFNYTR